MGLLGILTNYQFDIKNVVLYLVSCAIIILVILPIHEFAHAFASVKLGDPTPRTTGRYTLNPMAHISYLGSVLILLFGIGWADPVRVNPSYYKKPKTGMAITAFAGPFSNIVLALICIFLGDLLILICNITDVTAFLYGTTIFYQTAMMSIVLAIFNLIPIPPLDGFKILGAVLPDRIYFQIMEYERYIFIFVVALSYLGVFSFISYLSAYVMNLFMYFSSMFFGIFL